MKWQKIKVAADINFPDTKIELDITDGNLQSATLTHASGAMIRFHMSGYYNLQASEPVPPTFKTVWRLTGKVHDLSVVNDFDDEKGATQAAANVDDAKIESIVTMVPP